MPVVAGRLIADGFTEFEQKSERKAELRRHAERMKDNGQELEQP